MLVGPAGDVRTRAPVWEEHLLLATVDLDDLVRARADSPLLTDLRVALPHVLEQLRVVRAHDRSRCSTTDPSRPPQTW